MSKRILIMEDESAILEIYKSYFEMEGYSVTGTDEGAKAVQRYKTAKESGTPFDLAILDLNVPAGMGGEEAFRQIRQIDPEAKVIAISGGFDDKLIEEYRKKGFTEVVAKPVKMGDLVETVNRLLS